MSIFYFNASLGNNDTATAGNLIAEKIPSQLLANFSQPIVDDCSLYFCQIVRASISLLNMPICISEIQTGQPDKDLTVWSFVLNKTVGAVTYTSGRVFIKHIAGFQPDAQSTPVAPFAAQDFTQQYYFIYTFSTLVEMFNKALMTCFNQINLVLPIGQKLARAPFFAYNNYENKLSLYAPSGGDYIGTNPACRIWFNSLMFPFFNNFNYYNYDDNSTSGQDNYYIFQDYNLSGMSQTAVPDISINTTSFYDVLTESSSSACYFAYIKKVKIIANFNINPEISYVDNGSGRGGNIQAQTVLFDFIPPINKIGGSNDLYIYESSDMSNRLFEIPIQGPLQNFYINIQYEDKYGNSIQLNTYKTLDNSLKIGFYRKELFFK